MPDKLVKHGRLARSGIYQYAAREIPSLGLPLPAPKEIGEKPFYEIYRPANVLAKAVKDGLFTRMPMTRGHPDEWVDPGNFKEHVVGFTGDTAEIEYLPDIREVAVSGSMALAADEAIDAYERGVVDLSPGYAATFRWRKGKTGDGRAYDAVMTSIEATNHLALVNKGRGGSTAAILDAEGSMRARDIASRLWYRVKKRLLVTDEAMEQPVSESTGFRSALHGLINERAALSDEELAKKVDELKTLVRDLPENDEKGLLLRYMEDMKLMKEEKDDAARDVASLACGLFDKLDKHALSPEGGSGETMKDCMDCHGTGKIGSMDCATCGGKGKIGDDVPGATGAAEYSAGGKEGGKGVPREPAADAPEVPAAAHTEVPTPSATEVPKVGDEPDPAVPAAVPPAKQPPSPSPGGVPAAAPAAGAAQGGPQFWMTKLAELLKGMMADPQIQQMMTAAGGAPDAPAAPPAPAVPGAVPGAAAPAPASEPVTPAAAAPSAKPEGAPAEGPKKEGPPSGGAKDSAPSLTALLASSDAGPTEGATLDGIITTIKGRKG